MSRAGAFQIVAGFECARGRCAGAAVVPVPCGEASLTTAAATANAHPGSSIDLTEDCTYQLTAALPAITAATTVNGYHAILARTQTTAPFRILRGDAAGVGELVGSLPRVGAAEDVAPGRFFSQPECFRAFGDLLDQPPAAAGVPPRAGFVSGDVAASGG